LFFLASGQERTKEPRRPPASLQKPITRAAESGKVLLYMLLRDYGWNKSTSRM